MSTLNYISWAISFFMVGARIGLEQAVGGRVRFDSGGLKIAKK